MKTPEPVVMGGSKKKKSNNRMAAAREAALLNNELQHNINESNEDLEPRIETGANVCIPDQLALDTISPDPTNARDFIVIKPEAEIEFLAQEKNKSAAYAIIDKGRIENKTPTSHPLFAHMQKQIEDIKSFAEQVKEGGGVYQAIEVYRLGGTSYRIVFGHRRFYSVIFLMGWDGVWSFQVHRNKPENPKVRQFVENSSRSELALHENIRAYKMANNEVLNTHKNIPKEKLIALLGVSRTQFYRLEKFTKFPFILDAARDGVEFITQNLLIDIFKNCPKVGEMNSYDPEFIKEHLAVQFKNAGKKVPAYLEAIKAEIELKDEDDSNKSINEEITSSIPDIEKVTRGRKTELYKAPKIKSAFAVKTLLTMDVTKMEIEGIDWDSVEWSNRVQVNECLSLTIKALEKLKS